MTLAVVQASFNLIIMDIWKDNTGHNKNYKNLKLVVDRLLIRGYNAIIKHIKHIGL